MTNVVAAPQVRSHHRALRRWRKFDGLIVAMFLAALFAPLNYPRSSFNSGTGQTKGATDAGEVYQITAASGQSITYGSYDSIAGRPLNLYAGPLTVTNAYDAKGRTTSVSNHVSGGANENYSVVYGAHDRVTSQNTPFGNWTYYYDGGDGKGFLHRAIRSDGVTFTYNWDSAGRPVGHVGNDYYATSRGNPSIVVVAGTMAAGLGTSTVKVTNPTTSTTAAYPTVNATTGAFSTSYTGLSGWQTFDIVGTITAAGMNGTDAKAEQVRQIFVPPATETLTVDNAGNLTGDSRWTYSWNDEGERISDVETNPAPGTPAMRIDYLYDSKGRRVQKTVSLGTTVTKRSMFLWDGWVPVREIQYDSTGTEVLRRTYTWGPDITGEEGKAIGAGVGGLVEIYEQPAGGTPIRSLPIYNCRQDVVGLVDGVTGAQVATYDYGPFGELLRADGPRADSCPFLYETRYYNKENGIYDYPQRGLKGVTWISRDPARELSDSANSNEFEKNNPLSNHDPLGLLTAMDIYGVTFDDNDPRASFQAVKAEADTEERTGYLYQQQLDISLQADQEFRQGIANRLGGATGVLGGSVETALGVAGVLSTSQTGVGYVVSSAAFGQGVDTVQARWRQMITGVATQSFTAQGLSALTGSQTAGNALDGVVQIGLTFGAGAFSSVPEASLARGFAVGGMMPGGQIAGMGPGAMWIGDDFDELAVSNIKSRTAYGPEHGLGNVEHNNALEDMLDAARSRGAIDLRKNRVQRDLGGKRVFASDGTYTRPDASYIEDGIRFNFNRVSNLDEIERELRSFQKMNEADPSAINSIEF